MGYAGYTPAKLPPGKASVLQTALWSIESMECLEVRHMSCTVATRLQYVFFQHCEQLFSFVLITYWLHFGPHDIHCR